MKKHNLMFVFLLVFLFGCRPEKKNPIEGTWDLISAKYTRADTTISMTKDKVNHGMKMIHDNHFVFVGRFVLKNDTIDNYGGGTYTLEDHNYTETILYHTSKSVIGKTVHFEVYVNNDTLLQKGPRKGADPEEFLGWELAETYVRLR